MNRLTSTAALVAVLAALGAYIYFVDSKAPAQDAAVKEKVFTVAPEQIAEVTIRAANGDQTTLRKELSGWKVVAPVQADADQTEPDNITNGLATLELTRVVDAQPSSVADFGLDPAQGEIAFTVSGTTTPMRLQLGSKTPTGSDLYARKVGEPRVFLIPASVENTFNRTTFDLRDRSITKVDRITVDSVRVTSGTQTVQFVRRNETEWNLTQPSAVRGDFGTIDGLINMVASGQVQKFVSDTASDAPEYGFASPVATVVFSTAGKSSTLTIGREVEGTYYARDSTRPLVFTVGGNLVKELQKPVHDLRRKDLFDFRVFNVARLSFALGAETLTLEKTKTSEGPDVWKNGGGKTLDTAKAEGTLGAFSALKADAFVAAAPASARTPVLTVTATFDDGKTVEVVRFAKSGADVYAVRQDDPGAATLPAAAFDQAVAALAALR